VHGLGVGHDVEEFVFVESGGGSGGDVADIVGSGALGGQAEVGEFSEDFDGVAGLDFADLDVATGRDVAVVPAPVAGDFAEAAKLVGIEGAAGNAGTKHVGFLGRGDVEEAVEFEAEDVAIGGEFVFGGSVKNGVVAIETVLLVLDEFLAAEVLDGGAVNGFVDRFGGVIGELSR